MITRQLSLHCGWQQVLVCDGTRKMHAGGNLWNHWKHERERDRRLKEERSEISARRNHEEVSNVAVVGWWTAGKCNRRQVFMNLGRMSFISWTVITSTRSYSNYSFWPSRCYSHHGCGVSFLSHVLCWDKEPPIDDMFRKSACYSVMLLISAVKSAINGQIYASCRYATLGIFLYRMQRMTPAVPAPTREIRSDTTRSVQWSVPVAKHAGTLSANFVTVPTKETAFRQTKSESDNSANGSIRRWFTPSRRGL